MRPRALAVATVALLSGLFAPLAGAEGFTEADVLFYGEVRQVGGAHTVLLQAGELAMTFVNPNDAANTVTLTTALRPTGIGTDKPYSYALRVPLGYLPYPEQKDSQLSVGAQAVNFRIAQIMIDGVTATLADGSQEFFPLSFASKGGKYRLDLLTVGDVSDTDGDGLPDWWETLHGLDPNASDAGGDADGDGWSNEEEYRRGSDPNVGNRDPLLATRELRIPESGEAGLLLRILDSDTAPDQLSLAITVTPSSGFEIRRDGVPVAAGTELLVLLSDLEAGRVSVRHVDPAERTLDLPVAWHDGSTGAAAVVVLRVALPSTEDGRDASLWLDGNALGEVGSTIGSWPDRSGSGRAATQPLAEHRPVVAEEGGLRRAFFGAETAHLFFQETALGGSNQTVLAAYRAADGSDEPQTLFAGNRGFLQLEPTTRAISYPGAPRCQIDGLAVRGYASALGAASVSIFRREGGSLQHLFGLSYDGEAIAEESLEPLIPTLGARRSAIPGVGSPVVDAFHGTLNEQLIFPRALEEQKLRDVHDYLQSKWSGAVIWDLSTVLPSVALSATGPRRHIIRGGWGDDQLAGGPLDDILSGGPGADTLTGGAGADSFVYGGVDSGNDLITDFDPARDSIDLSALYWGLSGDARQYIGVRLDTDYSTPVPTLNSALIVRHPGGGSQEIVLRNVALGAAQLRQLIVEGRIRMGGLSIPTEVRLALAAGNTDPVALGEAFDDVLTFTLTRTGDGVSGAMDVPLGFFEEALGRSLILEGAVSKQGQRAVVSFAPGETTKTLRFRPVPDLDTQGAKSWEVAVLPSYRYVVGGNAIEGVITDRPRVWLEVLEPFALADNGQPARVRLFRDGDAGESLPIDVALDGTAVEGDHIENVPRTVLIPAGATFADMTVTPADGWAATQARMIHLAIVPRSRYQVGNPPDAVLYAANTASDASVAGFEPWLAAATQGRVSSYRALVAGEGQAASDDYLRAYAMGLASPAELHGVGLVLRVVDGKPELSAPMGAFAADLSWAILASSNLSSWVDATEEFTQELSASQLRLVGHPIDAQRPTRFYRMNYGVVFNPSLEDGVAELTGGSRLGVEGAASWTVDAASGALIGTANAPGQVSRLIVEAPLPAMLAFEMAVTGGDGSATLVCYIDGERVAETVGEAVVVQRVLTGTGTALLMWESNIQSGQAVIRQAP